MKSLIATLATAATLVAAAPPAVARAQSPHAAADSLVQLAMARAAAGDTSGALDLLDRATHADRDFAPAFYNRGRLLASTTSLGMSDVVRRHEATRAIDRALEIDHDNPLYLVELGRIRLKTPFLRLDAERLFHHALDAARRRNDPTVLAEVHWELGEIHERRYITMAHRRMLVGNAATFNADVARSDWHYTPDFLAQQTVPLDDPGEIDYRQAEDEYRAALAADPSHLGAELGLLGLLCDRDRYEEMARVARDAIALHPQEPRLLMALGLALHRMDRDTEADSVFSAAVAVMPEPERRDMLGLATVLRRDAAASYQQLSDSARAALDSLYWDVADPLELTRVNEAHTEFLARVAYADLRFSSDEGHLKGWKTDRGVILIRYGMPPVIATFAPETQRIAMSDAMGRVTTVWYYPDSKLRFVFVGPPAMNYAFFAGDFRDYAENARSLEPISFHNLASSLHVDSIPVQVARFRADSGRAVDVSFYADVPTAEMMKGVDLAEGTMETGLFLSDGDRRKILTVRDSSTIRARPRDPVSLRSWRRLLAPGEYLYRIEARETGSGHSARGLSLFDVTPFPAGAMSMSDILVARHIALKGAITTPRSRNDLLITPNGSLTFAPHDTVYLYWEDYGVRGDSTNTAHLEVSLALRLDAIDRGQELSARVLGGLVDAIGLSAKGDDQVSLRYQRTIALDSGDRIPNYLALDLGDAPYGRYTLELTVKDLVSGRATTRTRVLTVPRP